MSTASKAVGVAVDAVVVVGAIGLLFYLVGKILPGAISSIKKALSDAAAGAATNAASAVTTTAAGAVTGAATGVGTGIDQAVGSAAGLTADQVALADALVPEAGFGPSNEIDAMSQTWSGFLNWLRTGNFVPSASGSDSNPSAAPVDPGASTSLSDYDTDQLMNYLRAGSGGSQ